MHALAHHWSAVICSTVSRILFTVVPILISLLCGGCAPAQKAYHFTAQSVTRVSYDPKHCTEQQDGTFRCRDVILTVGSIQSDQK